MAGFQALIDGWFSAPADMHVQNLKGHFITQVAIIIRLKLPLLLTVSTPEIIPFLPILGGWDVDFPVNVFARLTALSALNRLNALVATKCLAAVDACPGSVAHLPFMFSNGLHARRRPHQGTQR